MDQNKNNDIQEDLKYKIKNRESIAKILLGVITFALLAYKIALSNFSFDFSGFSFTDLLSLILAIFAIALSVAFYFKATDTSNKFYDNTFKFTKDISEILGRIEAGFGERLRHLDEGYTGLRNKFEGSGIVNTEELDSSKKELEKEKEKLEKEITEKDEILSTLMQKAKLSESEKKSVIESLKNKETEILNLNKELHFLKREIRQGERARENELTKRYPATIINMLMDFLKINDYDIQMIIEAPEDFLLRKIKLDKEKLPAIFFERFLKFDIIADDGRFTPNGIELLRILAKRI